MAHHEVAEALDVFSEATIAFNHQLSRLNCYPNIVPNLSSSLLELTAVPTRDNPYPVIFNKDNLVKWKALLVDPVHSQNILDLLLGLIPLCEGIYTVIEPVIDAVSEPSTNRLVQAKLDELLPFRPYLGIQLIFILRHLLGDVFPNVNQHCQYIAYSRASQHLLATYHKKPWIVIDTLFDELGHLNIQPFFDVVFEAKDFKLREQLSPDNYNIIKNAISTQKPLHTDIKIPVLFPYEYQVEINNDVISYPIENYFQEKIEKEEQMGEENQSNDNNNQNKIPNSKQLIPLSRTVTIESLSKLPEDATKTEILSLRQQFELVPICFERRLAVVLEALFDLIFSFYGNYPELLPKSERHVPLSIASSLLTIPYTTIQVNELIVAQLNLTARSFQDKIFSQPSQFLNDEHGSVVGIFLHRFLSSCALPITESPIPSLIQCGIGDQSILPSVIEAVSVYSSSFKKNDPNQKNNPNQLHAPTPNLHNILADHIILYLAQLFYNYIRWTVYRTQQDVRCDGKVMQPFGQIQSQLMLMEFLQQEENAQHINNNNNNNNVPKNSPNQQNENSLYYNNTESPSSQAHQALQNAPRKVFYSPSGFVDPQSPASAILGIEALTELVAPKCGQSHHQGVHIDYFDQSWAICPIFYKCNEIMNQIRLLILSNESFLSNVYCKNDIVEASPFKTLLDDFCISSLRTRLTDTNDTDFLTIDLIMEYILASRESYKANFSREADGKIPGFDYDASPEALSSLHPNTPHPEKWRLWDFDLRMISRYCAAWYAKLQYGYDAVIPSNFFPIVNFYLRGQYGARILQYRSIYKNDAKPSKLQFSNVTHYDLYLHPKLTHLFKNTSLNLLPACNEYSILRQSLGQEHIRLPTLFHSHREIIQTLYSTLQQFVDITTSPLYSRCGFRLEPLLKVAVKHGDITHADLDGLLTSGVIRDIDVNTQALSSSFLYFLNQMVHQNFGENLFLLSSSTVFLNYKKTEISHLPNELLNYNAVPTLHLYLNTLSALHKFIFQPNVIVTPLILSLSHLSQFPNDFSNAENNKFLPMPSNSQKLINGQLQQHPIKMLRPLYALYVDTLLYILQGFSYSAFELSRKQHNVQTTLELTLDTPGLHLHSYYQENSSIRRADNITTALALRKVMQNKAASLTAKKVTGRGGARAPQKSKKDASKEVIPQRMDSYDYNMNRTKVDVGIMRQIQFHVGGYNNHGNINTSNNNQNNHYDQSTAVVNKKLTGFDEYERQYEASEQDSDDENAEQNQSKENEETMQEENEDQTKQLQPRSKSSHNSAPLIPYTTEATSAMVQFCIESFIDLLLVDDIYQVVKTFDFSLDKELPEMIPISEQTQNFIPTLGQLTQTKGLDDDFSGLFVEKGFHRYRDYDALHPEECCSSDNNDNANNNNDQNIHDRNDQNKPTSFLLNDPLSISIRNDSRNTNPDALKTIRIAKKVQNLDVAITSLSDERVPYIKHRDNNSAPVVMPSKPQHFGFFYGLPQDELDALFDASALNNIGYNKDLPLTTNNGVCCTKYPISVQNCDYFPVFGLEDTGHNQNYLNDGRSMAFDPFSVEWKELVKIDRKGIVKNINTLIEEFFQLFPTQIEFTPSSLSKTLNDYWNGPSARDNDVGKDSNDLVMGDQDQEVVPLEQQEEKKHDNENDPDTKPKLFSYLQHDDPFGLKLKNSERIPYPVSSSMLDGGDDSNNGTIKPFVYNHTQSLKPLTAELLINLFETRRDKFTQWE